LIKGRKDKRGGRGGKGGRGRKGYIPSLLQPKEMGKENCPIST